MIIRKIILILTIAMLSGCLFSTPNSNFYLLESSKTSETKSSENLNIAVQDIILADYLQRPQIILQKQDEPELKISEFNRWASDLDMMIQNILIEDLQQMFPNSMVKPLTYGSKAKYVVKINIEKMGGYFKQKAYIQGTWQVLSANGKILKQNTFNLYEPMSTDYASYAKAQSKLISLLAKEIGENIK